MIDLDDVAAIEGLDSEGVLGAVERFGDQVREAWAIGRAASGLPDGDGVESVVVLGMGGSGISGDVLQAVVEERLPLPIRVVKSYGPLPEWVGRNTLVLAVSYSGSTEETLAGLEDALAKGARIVTVSSGGPLAETARRNGVAHLQIPGGLQPRASLGYLTLPLFAVLCAMGLLPDMTEDVDEAVEVLTELGAACDRRRPRGSNPSKDLAGRIVDRVPVVYGGAGVGAVAAYRFKCDLNEYGKTPAFFHEFPELNHNEIVGWNRLSDLTAERFVIVLLRSPTEHERVTLRIEITRRLIGEAVADVVEVEARGRSALARILSLVAVTQLAAIYVGLAYGVDPGPVEVIQALKTELADR